MGPSAPSDPLPVSLERVRAAAAALRGRVARTPLVPAPKLAGLEDHPVYLKLENLQYTGSFKIRGATVRIDALRNDPTRRGVVAASAGNHAQGVAWAARAAGLPATIVMPAAAPPVKVSATAALGATVVLHGTDYAEAESRAQEIARTEGRVFIHPFDDPDVIAGQGTVGLEILEDLPDVANVVAGVGGGGLVSGLAVAMQAALHRPVRVIGVQPSGASTLAASLERGSIVAGPRPRTFADGLATRHVGALPFAIAQRLGVRAIDVDDRSIARAIFWLLERAKILAEGAGAAALAGVMARPDLLLPGPVVVVVSGGNLDPFVLDRVLWVGLVGEGRLLRLSAPLADVPGRLVDFLSIAAEARANVRQILHERESPGRDPSSVGVEVELEVRDAAHADEVTAAYERRGWAVRRVPLEPE